MSDTAIIDWDVKPLSQLAEARRGITYSSAMLKSEEGGLPYINMKSFLKGGGFNVEGTKHYAGTFTQQDVVGERDLLIANTDVTAGDIIGVPALLPAELAAEQVLYSHHVTRLRINGEVTVPFLYYLLCLPEYRSQMLRIARGTTVLMLDMPAIKRITICAPKNGIEQNRIVEVLSTLDNAIERTEALIAKYQQLKAGLMHDLFTRGVTSGGKLRPSRAQAPELYQETPIGWIPKEWEASGLKARAVPGTPHLRTGPFGSSLKGEHWVDEGHPVITIGALGEGTFIESELLYVSDADAKRLRDFQLKEGEVVFSRVADVGRSIVIREEQIGWIMSSNLMRISLDKKRVIPEILQQQLAFDDRLKRQIRAKVNSGGRDVANSEILNQLLFVWPTYIEQQLMVERATAIDCQLRSEEGKLEKLEKQKHGLMHDLLTGSVRVLEDIQLAAVVL